VDDGVGLLLIEGAWGRAKIAAAAACKGCYEEHQRNAQQLILRLAQHGRESFLIDFLGGWERTKLSGERPRGIDDPCPNATTRRGVIVISLRHD
jgi:hypothetical protein